MINDMPRPTFSLKRMLAVVFLAFSLITVSGPQTVTFDACLAIVAKLAEFYRFLLAFFWISMPLVGLLCVAACWAFDRDDATTNQS